MLFIHCCVAYSKLAVSKVFANYRLNLGFNYGDNFPLVGNFWVIKQNL
jgi:hypothetical protein